MSLNIQLAPDLEQTLRQQFGTGLEREVRENLAIAWFTQGRISSHQVASLLELELVDALQFLKDRGTSNPLAAEHLAAEMDAARKRIASKMPSREEWQKIIKKSREAGAAEKQQQLEDTEMNS